MKRPPFELTKGLREAVDIALRESCTFRAWTVVALNVRTNHVHLVVQADKAADDVLKILKARVTGSLRDQDLVDRDVSVWSRGGSHRTLWKEHEVDAAAHYTLNRQ